MRKTDQNTQGFTREVRVWRFRETTAFSLMAFAWWGICLCIMLTFAQPSEGFEKQRVLFLSSYHPAFPTFFQQLDGIRSVLDSRQIHVDVEFLDSKRIYDAAHFHHLYRLLLHKLERLTPYDAVLVSDDRALNFVLRHQQDLFAHIPIVFFGVNDQDLARAQNANPLVTGVVESVSMEETLELMIRLTPEITTVYAIVDDTPSGQGDLKTFYRSAAQFPNLTFSELSLTSLSFEELGEHLAKLTSHSAVLLLSAYHDRSGNVLDFNESLAFLHQHSPRPIYHLWQHGIGDGVFGGKAISFFEHGRAAASIALRILNGDSVQDIPVLTESPNHYMFDFREMQRFGIQQTDLPAESIVLHLPDNFASFYRRHTRLIWTTAAITLALLLLIFGLSLNIIRRHQAERQLQWELALNAILVRMSNALLNSPSLEEMADIVLDHARAFTRSEHGYVSSIDPETKNNVAHRLVSMMDKNSQAASESKNVTFPLSPNGQYAGLRGHALNTLRAFYTNDPATHPAVKKLPDGHLPLKNFLSAPAVINGTLVGQIALTNARNGYTDQDLEGIGKMADLYAVAVHRSQTEQQLVRLATVIEQATDSVIITDLQGKILYVNPHFERSSGYTEEEALGKTPNFLKSGHQDDQFYKDLWQTITDGRTWRGVFTNKRKDGSLYYEAAAIFPIRTKHSHIINYASVRRDVTDQVQTQHALQNALTFQKTLLMTIPIPVFYKDRQEVYLGCNPAFSDQILGIPPEKVIGHALHDLPPATIPRNLVEMHHNHDQRLLRDGGSLRYEAPVRCADGETRDFYFNKSTFADKDGTIAGIVCTMQDVTDKNDMQRKLQVMVEERTKAYQKAQEQLARQEKLALIGQMAGSVGHELRTPLGVISNAVYYLKMVLPNPEDTVEEYLDLIASEVRNSQKIITDLLDFSRVKSIAMSVVAVSDIVKQAVANHTPPAAIQIVLNIPADIPTIRVDPHHLDQVMGNLMTNAYQAMPQGGTLRIRATQKGAQVIIAIHDTGCGIAEEHLDTIFDPLFTTKTKGIGLGLSVSKNLIEANQGHLHVESVIGQGSTFFISLPPCSSDQTNKTASEREAEKKTDSSPSKSNFQVMEHGI